MHFSEDIWEKITLLWHKGKSEDTTVTDEEMKCFMKDWFAVRKSLLSTREYKIDTSEAWNKLNARTEFRKISLSRYSAWAAVFILGIGLAFYFLSPSGTDTLSLQKSFPSGAHKAELILSNGQVLVLDSMKQIDFSVAAGTGFKNNLKQGELSYEAKADSSVLNKGLRPEYHTLKIPKGGDYSILLPDGTRVWLNSESTFRFPTDFASGSREVWLNGEAYFKVARDTASAFTVHLPLGKINVLGTSFNVSAYQNDNKWHTVLVKGKVKVSSVNGDITLKPSDMYTVDNLTGQGSMRTVDTDIYTSWVDGKFYFNAFSFEEIVRKLERWYDFEMLYEDDAIRNMHFTGTINKHKPMEEVLHFLEKTTNIRFKINGKQIIVSKTN